MVNRQQIQQIPGVLRTTVEKAHAEYGKEARKVRWGDGPIYVCGAGDCAALGLAARFALETFAGWPVVAHPVEVFKSYALPLLQPRSVLLMISAQGECPEAQDLARIAQQRGCILVILANTAESPLVKSADHVFFVPTEGDAQSPIVTVSIHAALNVLAFEAARALKRPEPQWESLGMEFNELPGKLEWVFTQLTSVVRSLAAELAGLPRLRIVGGGFYHFPALQAARRLRSLASPHVEAVEATEFLSAGAGFARKDEGVLFLSGSDSKMKKVLHHGAANARMNGARVLSVTDSNDRDLAERSDLGILIPAMMEAPSSILMTFIVEWLAMETLRMSKQPPLQK
jgi:DNA-binding MurR/RpiR family transcriptional regulator